MKVNCFLADAQILKIEEKEIQGSTNKWYNLIFLSDTLEKNEVVCTKEVASRCKAGDKASLVLSITEEPKPTPDGRKAYIVSKFKITDVKVLSKSEANR